MKVVNSENLFRTGRSRLSRQTIRSSSLHAVEEKTITQIHVMSAITQKSI